jgi:hypothetical protein
LALPFWEASDVTTKEFLQATAAPFREVSSEPPKSHHLDRRAKSLIAACEGPDDELLNPHAVSEWLGVSPQWLSIGRCKNYGPKFQRLSSQVIRYKRADVKAWLADRLHASTSEYA